MNRPSIYLVYIQTIISDTCREADSKVLLENFSCGCLYFPAIRYRSGPPCWPVDLSNERIYGGSSVKLISKHEGGRSIELAATQKIECPETGRACRPIYDT